MKSHRQLFSLLFCWVNVASVAARTKRSSVRGIRKKPRRNMEEERWHMMEGRKGPIESSKATKAPKETKAPKKGTGQDDNQDSAPPTAVPIAFDIPSLDLPTIAPYLVMPTIAQQEEPNLEDFEGEEDPLVAEVGEDATLSGGIAGSDVNFLEFRKGSMIAGAGFLVAFIVSLQLIGKFRDKANDEPNLETCSWPSDEDSMAEEYEFRRISGLPVPNDGTSSIPKSREQQMAPIAFTKDMSIENREISQQDVIREGESAVRKKSSTDERKVRWAQNDSVSSRTHKILSSQDDEIPVILNNSFHVPGKWNYRSRSESDTGISDTIDFGPSNPIHLASKEIEQKTNSSWRQNRLSQAFQVDMTGSVQGVSTQTNEYTNYSRDSSWVDGDVYSTGDGDGDDRRDEFNSFNGAKNGEDDDDIMSVETRKVSHVSKFVPIEKRLSLDSFETETDDFESSMQFNMDEKLFPSSPLEGDAVNMESMLTNHQSTKKSSRNPEFRGQILESVEEYAVTMEL